ncbi:hypothetical protein L207DRAFT_517004 [Hyaloscypha variabilis F]|uniref:Uncharacterized protein n=1 Tax=Hyaloscypha variabilis (strain UAMH 11265 / GT02V1 / F) TaxID=1149755 RepID=A0A2J6R8M7_HYAVF|nr:hypothetical protein L207DRAFT_517004 [Hyaloscypha variabilis F]
MSISKIWSSLASTSTENTLSLVQFNFDFTFHKDVAPIEYRSIGQALSKSRRLNAEDGAAHRTARKLGWLFAQVIPDTPELLAAYGRRVSEILQMPGINPIGSEADGPFRDFVGADCTSLWAAATSGVSSLGVHLLACMIARDWDGPKATAIWVELVGKRSEEIARSLQENRNVSVESLAAARQDFSRTELGEWDTSVRSWLGQADKAFEKERDQFLLIAKNVALTIGSNKDPYTNVIPAWTNAMEAMEKHLKGISQEISDGAVLKAISAWHLYPDLVHFGKVASQVTFSDPLFTKPARMTLGLTEIACTRENRGIHWSLALSHLRYYGDPVTVESVEDHSRATLAQFQIILLGSVLESWRVETHDWLDAIQWIHELWEYLKKTAPPKPFEVTKSGHTSWLAVLADAADTVLSASRPELERHQDYLSYGERLWDSGFLVKEEQSTALQPYFGLCNPMVMYSLEEAVDVDAGIEFLRQLAKNIGLEAQDAIICYSDRKSFHAYYEYCTAVAHLNSQGQETHGRWIKAETTRKSSSAELGRNCHHKCHERIEHAVPTCEIDLKDRSEMIRSKGEICFALDESSLYTRLISVPRTGKKVQQLFWKQPVPLYQGGNGFSASSCLSTTPCRCFTPLASSFNSSHIPNNCGVIFERYSETRTPDAGGLPDAFELYIRTTSPRCQISELNEKVDEAIKLEMEPSHGAKWLKNGSPQPNRLWDYMQSLVLPALRISPQLIMQENVLTPSGLDWQFSHGRAANLITTMIRPPPKQWIRSWELLNVTSQIYRGLPGATISLEVFNRPIFDAYWTYFGRPDGSIYLENIPLRGIDGHFGAGDLMEAMGRPEIFSSIALMETGISNIEPRSLKNVIAMSSRNSIFVAGTLLSDPHESVPATNVRHIVGNVGFTGLNLMVLPPGTLTVRSPSIQVPKMSQWSSFEGERKDSFLSTSLHILFTGQRFSAVLTDRDTIDQGIFFVETVISLCDDGKHLADLDLLGIEKGEEKNVVTRIKLNCSCRIPKLVPEGNDIRCLDSWRDVLRPPRRTSIMRAHGNGPVRLAAASLLIQLGKGHTLGILSSEPLCWRCLEANFGYPEPHLPQILID